MRLDSKLDGWARVSYGLLLAIFSLPFHYVFWGGLYSLITSKSALPPPALAVLIGMGLAAVALDAFGAALALTNWSPPQMPTSWLYVFGVLFAINAVYQATRFSWRAGIASALFSTLIFGLARQRRGDA